MKRIQRGIILAMTVFVLVGIGRTAWASLIFQTYIDGGTAGDKGSDQDTWFSGDNPFDLYVVGQYQGNVSSIDNAWLVVSILEGEMGTIGFDTTSSGDAAPVLITSTAQALYGLPSSNANVDIFSGGGNDGYAAKGDFLPGGVFFNEHDPFKDGISDFLVYDLGSFGNGESVNNYNADDGTISLLPKPGEQKEYEVTYTGFSKLHFDVIGQVTDKQGTNWEINPGSHDASAVLEPASMLLLGTGLMGLAGLRRKLKK
jgi:hypothetical protein